MSALEKITDYGLGSYKGNPLVYVGNGKCYHLHRHGNVKGWNFVTFTEPFARDGYGARPCRVCFASRAENDEAPPAVRPGAL